MCSAENAVGRYSGFEESSGPYEQIPSGDGSVDTDPCQNATTETYTVREITMSSIFLHSHGRFRCTNHAAAIQLQAHVTEQTHNTFT
jgi:hypothetical protein